MAPSQRTGRIEHNTNKQEWEGGCRNFLREHPWPVAMSFVAEVHDRVPVLLKPDQLDHWLSGSMGVEELKPAANGHLKRWPASATYR